MQLLADVAKLYLPNGAPRAPATDEPTAGRWRRRHAGATATLREAGIATAKNVAAAAEQYVALRAEWEPYVVALADYLAHPDAEIDPVGAGA